MRKDDLGHPEQCEVAYKYYEIFVDEETVKTCACECCAGKRGCADCKRQLASIINEKFAPVREKRAEYAKDMAYVDDVLAEGAKKARVEAQKVISKVRSLINMY